MLKECDALNLRSFQIRFLPTWKFLFDDELLLKTGNKFFTSKDVRYVVFDAKIVSERLSLDKLYVVNGEHFTEVFPLFQGKVQNKKLQIPLPRDFFD